MYYLVNFVCLKMLPRPINTYVMINYTHNFYNYLSTRACEHYNV